MERWAVSRHGAGSGAFPGREPGGSAPANKKLDRTHTLMAGIRSGSRAAFQLFYLLTAWEVLERLRENRLAEALVPLAAERVYREAMEVILAGEPPNDVPAWLLSLSDAACRALEGCAPAGNNCLKMLS